MFSGIVHTGFDVTPNTLEAECLYNSLSALPELHLHNVTTSKTGAVMVAWSDNEVFNVSVAMKTHSSMQLLILYKIAVFANIKVNPTGLIIVINIIYFHITRCHTKIINDHVLIVHG